MTPGVLAGVGGGLCKKTQIVYLYLVEEQEVWDDKMRIQEAWNAKTLIHTKHLEEIL